MEVAKNALDSTVGGRRGEKKLLPAMTCSTRNKRVTLSGAVG